MQGSDIDQAKEVSVVSNRWRPATAVSWILDVVSVSCITSLGIDHCRSSFSEL